MGATEWTWRFCGGIGKGLSRPLNSWGNGHVAVDIVIMYSALMVGGVEVMSLVESCARE
jgi:hypothetical protein